MISAEDETRLAVALCLGMTQRLQEIFHPESEDSGPKGYFWHMATQDFERPCYALWEIGAALGGTEDATGLTFEQHDTDLFGWPHYFRCLDEAEIRNQVSNRWEASALTIDNLIEAYLGVATDYGGNTEELLHTGRNSLFVPGTGVCQETMECFVDLGYATKRGEALKWTDKIGPHMLENWFWSEQDCEIDHLDQEKINREASGILSQLRAFDALKVDQPIKSQGVCHRALHIMTRWDGDRWVNRIPHKIHWGVDMAIAIAKRLDI